ncbi:N-acetylglucosamine-6-phosphate deacetylase [Streptomyces sp. NPDC054865]
MSGCVTVHGARVTGDGRGPSTVRAVTVCQGKVATACPHPGRRLVDAAGLWAAPGLVDLHVHGAVGRDFTDPDPTVWQQILGVHQLAGTTTVLATLASDAPARMYAATQTAAALIATGRAPGLAGVHWEGPALAPGQAGAHAPARLRSPREVLAELSPPPAALRMVTLAPEVPGARALTSHLAGHGVVVSAGHSAAGPAELAAAQACGLSHLAHLWSGQSTLTRPRLHRLPGLLEVTLASAGLSAEVIADGHHLPDELLRIAYRCLGPDRICLVSDATAGTGLPPGARFTVGASTGTIHPDGYATTASGTAFCGATVPLAAGLPRMKAATGAPAEDVITMATATPARAAGLYPRKGSLCPGADGDLVLLDADLRVRAVLAAGRWTVTGGAHAGT